MKNSEQFSMLIVGTGGQGLITLLEVLAEAAKIQNYEIKTSELHGLSQRGGSVEVHIRFGKKIYSPLIAEQGADLVLSLEAQESLKAIPFGGDQTTFLINDNYVAIPLRKNISEKEIKESLNKYFKKIYFVPASKRCTEELGKSVVAGIYLISLASFKGIIPLNPENIKSSILKTIPEKYQELNLKAFELAKKDKEVMNKE